MKFNLIINIFSILALYFLSTSCEKVIDVDLNTANPKPVFEAYMENDSTCYVKASWTSSYYDNSASPVIANATMTLSDQHGNNEVLTYEGNGLYRGSGLIGTIGLTYALSINLDGDSYTASSYMNPLIGIDSFSIVPSSGFFGGGGGGAPKFFVFVNYTDSANYKNYYAIETNYNDTSGKAIADYRIADDVLSDGISTRSFTTFYRFEQGDTLSVQLASIDYATHLYFKTLEDALTGAGFASAAPANPTSNFSGGALGYFGAWSKERKIFVVP